jgi:hypothetical protein
VQKTQQTSIDAGMSMKMKAYASFDAYLADQQPANQSIIKKLRRFVKRIAPGLRESVKWGNGCWIKEGAPIAYVYSAPDHTQFGFFAGSALRDPRGLLEGNGQWVRHVKLRVQSDIDERRFAALLRQADGAPCFLKAKGGRGEQKEGRRKRKLTE